MKAQIGIEFLFSVFIFLLTIIYATNFILNSIPSFIYPSENEIKYSDAFAISEYIIRNCSSGFYNVEKNKIENIDFNKFTKTNSVYITIKNLNDETLFNYGSTSSTATVSIRRFMLFNNQMAKMVLEL